MPAILTWTNLIYFIIYKLQKEYARQVYQIGFIWLDWFTIWEKFSFYGEIMKLDNQVKVMEPNGLSQETHLSLDAKYLIKRYILNLIIWTLTCNIQYIKQKWEYTKKIVV